MASYPKEKTSWTNPPAALTPQEDVQALTDDRKFFLLIQILPSKWINFFSWQRVLTLAQLVLAPYRASWPPSIIIMILPGYTV